MSRSDETLGGPERRTTDDEIGALLDGRLSGAAREDLLARIAESELDRRVLAETAELLEELEDERATGDSPSEPQPPLNPTRPVPVPGWRRPTSFGFLLAASIALAVVVPRFPRESDGDALPPFASVSWADGATIAAGWGAARWSNIRGGATPLSSRARSVRLGAHTIDLLVAARLLDTAQVRHSASLLEELASGLPVGGDLAASFASIRTMRAFPTFATLQSLAVQTRNSAESPLWFDVGRWAEAARLQIAARRWTDERDIETWYSEGDRIAAALADSSALSSTAARVHTLLVQLRSGTEGMTSERLLPAVDSLLADAGR